MTVKLTPSETKPPQISSLPAAEQGASFELTFTNTSSLHIATKSDPSLPSGERNGEDIMPDIFQACH